MQIKLAPDLSLLAIMVIFMLNCLVVRKFLFKPVNELLEERERDTRSADKLYEDALARFAEATAQTEAQLHSAKREAAQIRERFRGEANAYRQQIVEQTNEKGRAIVGGADEKLAVEVEAARKKIVNESDELARLAAERILGRAV